MVPPCFKTVKRETLLVVANYGSCSGERILDGREAGRLLEPTPKDVFGRPFARRGSPVFPALMQTDE